MVHLLDKRKPREPRAEYADCDGELVQGADLTADRGGRDLAQQHRSDDGRDAHSYASHEAPCHKDRKGRGCHTQRSAHKEQEIISEDGWPPAVIRGRN